MRDVKSHGETEVPLREFLTSPKNASGQIHVSATLPPEKRVPGTHCVGGRLSTTAVLDALQKRKIPATETLYRFPG